jgi:hypothetical protein
MIILLAIIPVCYHYFTIIAYRQKKHAWSLERRFAMTLGDKRVLVIAGGSDIGLGMARGAAREGTNVLIASRDPKKIAEAAENIGATSAAIDVHDENNVARFFKDNGAFDPIAFAAGDWEGIAAGALADLDLVKVVGRPTTRFWVAVAVATHGASLQPPGGSYTIPNGMIAHRPMKGLPIVTAGACAVEGLALGLAVDLAPARELHLPRPDRNRDVERVPRRLSRHADGDDAETVGAASGTNRRGWRGLSHLHAQQLPDWTGPKIEGGIVLAN